MGAKRVGFRHLSKDAVMKSCTRLVVILLLSATAAFAAAPGKTAKWLDDFAAAKAAARKEGKPILANFTGSDWCPWCIKLENEILGQKAFLDYAGTNMVLFIADFPQRKNLPARVAKQNDGLQAKYKIEGLPTVLLLDAGGNVLGQTGYQPGGAELYVAGLKELLEKSGWKPPVLTNRTGKVLQKL